VPYYHWWPKKNTTEWISYEFESEQMVGGASVIWYDDAPRGECRVPDSWKIYYKNSADKWIPAENESDYPTVKGVPNSVSFSPVKTTAVKMEIVLPKDNAAGIFEWSLE
jgi:hypothetical protein